MLPELPNQLPADQEIASLTADGAYDTCNCHDAIAERGAHAVIPPRKNAKPWKTDTAGAVARNEALRASRNTSVLRFGDVGADITAETAQKPGCTASNLWGNAS